MAEQLNQQMRDQFEKRLNPLRKGTSWSLVVVEGIVALGMGIFGLVAPLQFADVLGVIIGAYLLVVSILNILAELRIAQAGMPQPFRLIRGGIGLVTGLVATLQPLISTIDRPSAITVLVFGLGLYGIVGLIGLFMRNEANRVGVIVANALPLVFAGLLAYSLITQQSIVNVLSIVIIIGGVLLIGYGLLLYQQSKQSPTATVPDTVPDKNKAT